MKKLSLILIGFCVFFGAYAQSIKELKTESSYLVYPKVPIEKIDLTTAKIEFSHGEITVSDEKSVLKETNLCKAKGAKLKDAQAIETFYYKIKYTSPDAFVRIKNNSGEVVYIKKTSEKASDYDYFGKNECYFLEAILESAYNKMKAKNDSMIIANEKSAMYKKAQDFVNESLSFYYETENIEVYYVKDSKEFQYPELLQAANTAIDGYNALKNNYADQVGKGKLMEAIKVWDAAVAQKDVNDKKARINRRSAGRLYHNIALAYAYCQDYDNAIKSLNASLAMYSGISNNFTVACESLRSRLYDEKKYYEMNKEAEVKLATASNDIVIQDLGTNSFADFKSDYASYNRDDMTDKIAEAKKIQEEAVASGEVNKYQDKVLHSATQGYMLSLPTSLGATSLAEIQAAMKKLEEFPVEACDLVQLNQLILKNNHIKTIPADIKKLVNLKRLDLSKNELTELPVELGELKELNTLVLKGNPLKAGEVEKIQKLLPDCTIKL
ncbi:leucine-rich repeat domain-containing protein [Plebeiibacterium sediminum]|uniref:Leucine-rich repeat domain-containing protein n=1 Tax=Plebeiibacterium sediminum TaxID=2992112 RepID=A0AAE3SDT4_9BACT|nr:hypothetical protein [Plebeiobacterium sediminum]MCW3785222.1 hypothetical protein [Plebeiobacterium sediminum]